MKKPRKSLPAIKPAWTSADIVAYALDQAILSEVAALAAHQHCTDEDSERFKAEMRGRLRAMRAYQARRFGPPARRSKQLVPVALIEGAHP